MLRKIILSTPMRGATQLGRRGYESVVAGPPQGKITKVEQFFYGTGMIIGIMIMPVWGYCSVPSWREAGKKKQQ